MYKTILVQVDAGAGMDARLQAAARLAQAGDAHLVGSAATGMSWPAYATLNGSMAVMPVDDFEAMRNQARDSLGRFSERAQALGVRSSEEQLIEDDPRHALVMQSRYADLVVTSQEEKQNAARALPQYVAMHSARPVLAVPPGYAGQALGDNIVAAWDGSLQAVRAIGAALPLLARAGAVRLAVVNPDRESGLYGDDPGADMAQYLGRHGVRVDVVIERTHGPVGEALLGIARTAGADLLVAGAFGHSRYREIVLGGVTRTLLERAPVPALFAH